MKKLHLSSLALAVLMCLGMLAACPAFLPRADASAPLEHPLNPWHGGLGQQVQNSAQYRPLAPYWTAEAGPSLYVLMYHDVVPEGMPCNPWTVTDTRLREDLQWLADNGWTTVLPGQLAAGDPIPEKAVMLTFDDGYRGNYELAYPLLQDFQAKAVISIVVSYVDGQNPDFLTWDMCREMSQSGLVEIGSHTYASHDASQRGIRRLDTETRDQYEARIFPDLQTSIDLIEEHVGVRPGFFAYPNGWAEPWAMYFIRSHFSVAATTRYGPSRLSAGLYDLNRYNVSMGIPLSDFLPA